MNSVAPSPLATAASRDKYVRKPLPSDTPDVTNASSVLMPPPGPRNRRGAGGRIKDAASPPMAGILTSSPDPGTGLQDETPGVSMIGGFHSADNPDPPLARRVSKRTSRRRLNDSQSSQSSQSEGAFDDEDEDDDQPSATISANSKRSSRNSSTLDYDTPRNSRSSFKNDSLKPKKLQMESPLRNIKVTREPEDKTMYNLLLGTLVGTLLVLFAVTFREDLLGGAAKCGSELDINRTVELFHEEFMSMRRDFPGQDRMTWITMRASLKSILHEDPRQPSVLVLVSGKAEQATARCLASKVGCLINRVLGKDANRCSGMEAAKFDAGGGSNGLFSAMQGQLSGNASSVTLHGLERLPGSVAMALHAFCDNDNAPFKNAAVVMTIAADSVGGDEDAEVAAERVLREAWKGDLDEDRLSPLLSRVVVSAVKIDAEKKNPC